MRRPCWWTGHDPGPWHDPYFKGRVLHQVCRRCKRVLAVIRGSQQEATWLNGTHPDAASGIPPETTAWREPPPGGPHG